MLVKRWNDRAAVRRAALVGLGVFVACLLGIATRRPDTLAVFWPANALLLGVLLRSPRTSTPATWAFAAAGYFAADLVTGASPFMNVALNLCNLFGVAIGFAVFRCIGRDGQWLTRTRSLLVLAVITVAASGAAGLAGGFVNAALQSTPWSDGWTRWFAGQFLNYVSVLPAVLTAPRLERLLQVRARHSVVDALTRIVPAAGLFALCIALVVLVGGPGAITFAMPALVVAALTTGVFFTSVFVLLSTVWLLVLTADGRLGWPTFGALPATLSTSIGLSFLAVAPLAVAIVTLERHTALAPLRHAVAHDDLTGALRRDEFFRRVDSVTRRSTTGRAAVLMLDLDHFKSLNDTHGHSAGDTALSRFAADIRGHLDAGHLFARLGGEEFAVFLPDTSGDDATAIADSIRLGQYHRAAEEFGGHFVTVSIGVAAGAGSVELLFDAADRALYDAKRTGRNKIVTAAPADEIHGSMQQGPYS